MASSRKSAKRTPPIERIFAGSLQGYDPIAPYRDLTLRSFQGAKERIFGLGDIVERHGLREYDGDSVRFSREVLGHRTWEASRAIHRRLWEKKRVLLAGCRKSTKTFTAAEIVPAFMCTAPTICVTTASTWVQVRELLWTKIATNFAQARKPLPGRLGITSLHIGPQWRAIGISTNQPGRIQGFHAGIRLPSSYDVESDREAVEEIIEGDKRRAESSPQDVIDQTLQEWEESGAVMRMLWVLDEMPEIRGSIIESIMGSWMGDNVYVLGQGNPTLPPDSAHPYMRALRSGAGWWRMHIAGREMAPTSHPGNLFDECFHGVPKEIMPDNWVEERKADWGENSALFMAHVLGIPAGVDRERQFLPAYVMRLAAAKEIADDGKINSRHIGWDVAASEGGDFNVVSLVIRGALTDQVRWRTNDTIESANRVIDLARRWGLPGAPIPARNWHVDSLGVGKGPTDYMRQKGYNVDEVDFGAEALGDWATLTGDLHFANRKAELLWVLRRAIQEGIAAVPAQFEDVHRQAAWYTYKEVPRATGSSLAVAEKKDKIREDFGRSPDDLESLMCAWSRGSARPTFRALRDLSEISRR